MLSGRTARIGVAVVIVASVAAAAFHVATGPDHRRERHEIARAGCIASGGEWIITAQVEYCKAARNDSDRERDR